MERHLIAGDRAVDGLQNQFQGEDELQCSDHDGRGLALAHSNEIAAANLIFHLEAEPFEEAPDGKVESRFQARVPCSGSR